MVKFRFQDLKIWQLAIEIANFLWLTYRLINRKSINYRIQSVDKIHPIHEAQILTYMKLSKIGIGLLINFNEKTLKDGIKRFVL